MIDMQVTRKGEERRGSLVRHCVFRFESLASATLKCAAGTIFESGLDRGYIRIYLLEGVTETGSVQKSRVTELIRLLFHYIIFGCIRIFIVPSSTPLDAL